MNLIATNPFDQETVAEFPFETEVSLNEKLNQAQLAFQKWRKKTLTERIRIVEQGLEKIRQAEEEIVQNVTRQMGKPLGQARGEFLTMFDRAATCIELAPAALADDVLPDKPNFQRRIVHEPLGVVLDIAAWNYPLVIPINVIVPALLAGNTVLIKHSAKTPLCGVAFEDAFGALEVPNLVTNVILNHQQTEELIADDRINHVSFTGSVEGGRVIYRHVAERLIDAGLELGGNDAAYVAADADLDFAVANIVDGATYNAGQSCCAVERVYVHETVYDAFVDKALELMQGFQLGDPTAEGTTMGPLASRAALEELEKQVQDAVDRGAKLLCGGTRVSGSTGNFFSPTLLSDCPQDSVVMQEESFGPLLPVTKVASDEEALTKMNDSRFGLTASVWSADVERVEKMAADLQVGTIFQNRCDYLDPALPWTGWGESGLGSTLSQYGFFHLTQRKAIHFRTDLES
ncbi:Lactaldehyde dehydrogenase [Polystyrenella longa]|uniref:Lactaldehyde dehydrogenase n=1 Tax=Polystyrenella longa TaxID=2528007 RepID=A0A518CKN5_9PLAN|nr:aldehyde dehydrogenase family protein [Polystyrenella longa]QDU79789.1 Lactaldehyde dehydrogenase [Polystyrenella longa]